MCWTVPAARNISSISVLPGPASAWGPDLGVVCWCCYYCFSCWELEPRPKCTLVTIKRPRGPLLCSTLGFIGTGEHHQQVCTQSTTNLLRGGMRDQPESVPFLCLSSNGEFLSLTASFCSLPFACHLLPQKVIWRCFRLSNMNTRTLWSTSDPKMKMCKGQNTMSRLNRWDRHTNTTFAY